MTKILVTGAAGFIGCAACKKLIQLDYEVLGVDNLNNYYSPQLKRDRIKSIGTPSNFIMFEADIRNKTRLRDIFTGTKPNLVLHLAAQAGVRYSFDHPHEYLDNNVIGFGNILEWCRKLSVDKLIYASSSSVYGLNKKTPFSIHHNTDNPANLYAATKKANELMAYSYSHLYDLNAIGIRFFTVYGPWGRPDMAIYSFSKSIMEGTPIKLYNQGQMKRDFTYIDDVVDILCKLIKAETNNGIYNIGNNDPVELLYMVSLLVSSLGKKADLEMIPMQPGEMLETYADIKETEKITGLSPKTPIELGIQRFVSWFRNYHK